MVKGDPLLVYRGCNPSQQPCLENNSQGIRGEFYGIRHIQDNCKVREMRYYCPKCNQYWTNSEETYTIVEPVRLCADHLKEIEHKRWISVSKCMTEDINDE